ncbi:YbaB/EbfC family nucleoid-associated protein [Streptacidiphilus fuscans]|uniref:YbaB/EbfC family nucleoid-associated protein n=1 Tax=Streptacidiphilus fuscans TaxID=2789292 RepID=A0A931BFL4_9ACTN|nr:YbaB/EbfC family nucleoid-associated protein [Streptacidiphilus fuscans]MBF9072570.1 YbaB/EbfC family nucleoid-associated protein [Streptacidiphilus fuscans]
MTENDDQSGSPRVREAMARLAERRAKLQEMRREYLETTAEVTSKDRMVTAKVGAQGQVVSLTFHTKAYQSMAPAELASALTDLLNRARADVGEKLIRSTERLDGVQDLLRIAVPGGGELKDVLEPLRAMRPGYAEEQARKNRTRKQEEFNG